MVLKLKLKQRKNTQGVALHLHHLAEALHHCIGIHLQLKGSEEVRGSQNWPKALHNSDLAASNARWHSAVHLKGTLGLQS